MPHIHYPSLVAVLSAHAARWYRVENEKIIQEVGRYEDKKDTYEDHEGRFGRTGGEPDTLNARRSEEERQNFRAIAAKTASLYSADAFVHLVCAVPDHHKGLAHSELDAALDAGAIRWVYGDHTKSSKKDILALFKKSLKSVNP